MSAGNHQPGATAGLPAQTRRQALKAYLELYMTTPATASPQAVDSPEQAAEVLVAQQEAEFALELVRAQAASLESLLQVQDAMLIANIPTVSHRTLP